MSRGNYQVCRDCKWWESCGTKPACVNVDAIKDMLQYGTAFTPPTFGCVHWQSKDPDYKEAVSAGCDTPD